MKQVREVDPEIAAMREEYWRSLIVESQPKPAPKPHPLRPWQQVMLDKKLDDPFSDREVIFVVDETGAAGKSWFVEHYSQTRGRICYDVPADKREHISYSLINKVIEGGQPDVIFMDAPRARAQYVSSPFLEELKDGKVNAPKYKRKTLYFQHKPHVVVMMNEFPKKNLNEKGLSNDRYTYLVIDKEGENGMWSRGFINAEGAMAPGFNPTPYDTIQSKVQSGLPDDLQERINKAFESNYRQPPPKESIVEKRRRRDGVAASMSRVTLTWMEKSENITTNSDKYVAKVQERACSKKFKSHISSRPMEQYATVTTVTPLTPLTHKTV